MNFKLWSYGSDIPSVWGVERRKVDGVPTVFFDLGRWVLAVEFNPTFVDWN